MSAAAFVTWARDRAIPLAKETGYRDLDAFGAMIEDATVVALSEALHGAAEPLEFRNTALEYLVREKGFTAIAIESGVVEGRRLHDFVRGAPGSLDAALQDGLSWTFELLPQNRALVQWLREYNADPRHTRKVNFYGFDVPGSPGESQATRGVDTALSEVLRYLDSVDPVATRTSRARLGTLLQNLRFNINAPPHLATYDKLSLAERDQLTAVINDAITLLEHREAVYSRLTSPEDHEWAYRAALGARQVDAWLRQIPLGWQPARQPLTFPSEQTDFIFVANDVRDRAQADNLQWILEREGEKGKVVVFAHRYHVSAAPVRPRWTGSRPQTPMGSHLRRRLGRRLVTVGNLIGQGSVSCDGWVQELKPAAAGTMDGIVGELGGEGFLLDLRPAPTAVASWLESERELAEIPLGEQHDTVSLSVGQAFDILLFTDTATPACPPRQA